MSESQTSLEQMESRLAELELKFGGALPPTTASATSDVTSRLDKLIRIAVTAAAPATAPAKQTSSSATAATNKAKADSKRSALHDEFRTIDRLLSELALDPVAGPTAASSANSGGRLDANTAPIVFRRMEVLASAESMKRGMDLLARIRDLTNVGAKTEAAGASSSSGGGDNIVNCPIVTTERYNLPSDPEAVERLDRLCFRVAKLNQRAAVATQRADEMLNSYGSIMMALSEKMVLAEEQIDCQG